MSLEIILEKPEKQPHLTESLEGLKAAVEERVLMSGNKLMTKLSLNS